VFEDILQEDETITIENRGFFALEGSSILVEGNFALTDKRLILVKRKGGFLNGSTLGAIVAFVGVLPIISGHNVGIIEAALLGGAAGLFGSLIGSMVENVVMKFKKTTKRLGEESIAASIPLEDIARVEEGKQGLQKVLMIDTKGDGVYKIGELKNLAEWKDALQKSVTAGKLKA